MATPMELPEPEPQSFSIGIVVALVLLAFGLLAGGTTFFAIALFGEEAPGSGSTATSSGQEQEISFSHSLTLMARQSNALFAAATGGDSPQDALVLVITEDNITLDGEPILELLDGLPHGDFQGLLIPDLLPILARHRVDTPDPPQPSSPDQKMMDLSSSSKANSTSQPGGSASPNLTNKDGVLILAESSLPFGLIGRLIHTAQRSGFNQFQLGGYSDDGSRSITTFTLSSIDGWRLSLMGPSRSSVGVVARTHKGLFVHAISDEDQEGEDVQELPYITDFNLRELKETLAEMGVGSRRDLSVAIQPDPSVSYEQLLQLVSTTRSAGSQPVDVSLSLGGLLPAQDSEDEEDL